MKKSLAALAALLLSAGAAVAQPPPAVGDKISITSLLCDELSQVTEIGEALVAGDADLMVERYAYWSEKSNVFGEPTCFIGDWPNQTVIGVTEIGETPEGVGIYAVEFDFSSFDFTGFLLWMDDPDSPMTYSQERAA